MPSGQRVIGVVIRFALCVALGLCANLFRPHRLAAADAPRLSFNRDIRPILSDNCFQCHGPDEKKREAGLRLDLREHALAVVESGAVAVVPHQPDRSELIRRITADNPDMHMPPASSGKQLTPTQVQLLRQWIAEGAEYQGHWAFLTPQRPVVPTLSATPPSQIRNPIDAFVQQRLARESLIAAPEANRETLIRRVSLDLTGIPPTLAEINDFLADPSDNAYEKVVDRLLHSKRYGERMAMQWLDFARYADSNGFQVDSSRFMWPWRDWVINAFNDNMPFDQFTVEQLAGDLLPNAAPKQIVATGFNRNHRLNGEGGLIAEEWRVETVIDRVETTGMTWLALTLNCCRCHDHKFDPISQREFYQFFAFFNNVPESGTLQGDSKNTEPTLTVPTAEQETELARLTTVIETAQQSVREAEKQLPQLVAAWEPGFREKLKSTPTTWSLLEPREVRSLGGATLTRQPDASWLASGNNPPHDTYAISTPIAAGQVSAIQLEAFTDPSLPVQSLGRYSNGNFVLSAVEAEITAPGLSQPQLAKLSRAEADYSQKSWEISLLLDDKSNNGWAVDGPTKKEPRRAIFVFETPLSVPADATLTIKLRHDALTGHNIGRFRLSASSLEPARIQLHGDGRPPVSVVAILETPAEQRSAEQRTELEKFFRANVANPLTDADKALASSQKQRDSIRSSFPSVMVMRENDKPRDTFVLKRGEYDKPGDKVIAALPAVFPQLPTGQPMNRLGLARWLVEPSHPLTSRVWVNRLWEKFFGIGLVKTSENFGSQSEWPSHPELLDWLATEFIRCGWDMKAMHKLVAMSHTYRQSTAIGRHQQAIQENDPDNRLLWRGPRFRLPAEIVRDQTLAISGLLVEKIGGPSVRPYMPDGVWDETSRYGDLRGYKHDTDDRLFRRTMYTIWKRTAAPPTMLLFDAPSREVCQVKRSRTNTPLQALALLNEVTYVEAARKLGERMMLQGGDQINDRLTFGFRLATGRSPTIPELQLIADGLSADLVRFQENPTSAQQLISLGESKPNTTLPPTELAAYTLTANVLLNLDEVITRE